MSRPAASAPCASSIRTGRKAFRRHGCRNAGVWSLDFVADDFKYNQALSWEGQAAFHNAYGPDALPIGSALLNGGLHRLIEQALDMDSEPASRSVVADLLDQAATFSRDPGSAGRSKPVGLFPGNLEMVGREEVAEFERLLAAWFYVSNRYATTEILSDAAIREAVYVVVEQLFGRHMARLPDTVQAAAGKIMDTIDEWREQHGQSPVG